MEIIASLIEGGCYSAVFAILLFVALKSGSKREDEYRKIISSLVESVKTLDNVDGKLDKLIATCEKLTERKKRKEKEATTCEPKLRVVSATEI